MLKVASCHVQYVVASCIIWLVEDVLPNYQKKKTENEANIYYALVNHIVYSNRYDRIGTQNSNILTSQHSYQCVACCE